MISGLQCIDYRPNSETSGLNEKVPTALSQALYLDE